MTWVNNSINRKILVVITYSCISNHACKSDFYSKLCCRCYFLIVQLFNSYRWNKGEIFCNLVQRRYETWPYLKNTTDLDVTLYFIPIFHLFVLFQFSISKCCFQLFHRITRQLICTCCSDKLRTTIYLPCQTCLRHKPGVYEIKTHPFFN